MICGIIKKRFRLKRLYRILYKEIHKEHNSYKAKSTVKAICKIQKL
jgi:hypothetical protein